MAPRARLGKRFNAWRTIIVLSSVLFLHFIATVLSKWRDNNSADGDWGKILEKQPDVRFLPDMAMLMTWGQGGSGVRLDATGLQLIQHPREDTMNLYQKAGYARHSMNEYLSNRISLRRQLPDMRERPCKSRSHPGSDLNGLPNASVIIVFHQEPRSVLLRAVFSILDRSPQTLLGEILLVDQGSEVEDLAHPQLENYLSAISQKVKVIRSQSALSYPEAINLGAATASGDVAVFVPARAECTEGWLPPLLAWLKVSRLSVAVPLVDTIDRNTFQYVRTPASDVKSSTFSWSLSVKRKKIHEESRSREPQGPESSPVMADGIFAVSRSLFLSLGGFTASLSGASISHVEFSLRAWLCGSRIELIPCSRVGLIRLPVQPLDNKNLMERATVAQWWMGEYQAFVHERLFDKKTPETVMSMTRLPAPGSHNGTGHPHHPARHRLTCNTFDWYLHTIDPAKVIEGHVIGSGRLRQSATELVLAQLEGDQVFGLRQPREETVTPSSPTYDDEIFQFWYLVDSGELRTEDDYCLSHRPRPKKEVPVTGADADEKDDNTTSGSTNATTLTREDHSKVSTGGEQEESPERWSEFYTVPCGRLLPRRQWTVTEEHELLHIPSDKCLTSRAIRSNVKLHALQLEPCGLNNTTLQRWQFSHTDPLAQGKSSLVKR